MRRVAGQVEIRPLAAAKRLYDGSQRRTAFMQLMCTSVDARDGSRRFKSVCSGCVLLKTECSACRRLGDCFAELL